MVVVFTTTYARCTTSRDTVCQWLATDRWFSPGTPVSSTNKTDRHDITELLLKVASNTIKQINKANIKLTTHFSLKTDIPVYKYIYICLFYKIAMSCDSFTIQVNYLCLWYWNWFCKNCPLHAFITSWCSQTSTIS